MNEPTIAELLDNINAAIEDIHNNPTKFDRVPSNLEILLTGINGSDGLEFLFSPKLDKIITELLRCIESGEFNKILNSGENVRTLCDNLFGKGSFQGPVSEKVLGNIQQTMQSQKYQTMKSLLGKSVTKLKKIRLVMKNLEAGKKSIKNAKELESYTNAIYAIKQVLIIINKVLSARKNVNEKVMKGLNAIVHENKENE